MTEAINIPLHRLKESLGHEKPFHLLEIHQAWRKNNPCVPATQELVTSDIVALPYKNSWGLQWRSASEVSSSNPRLYVEKLVVS